MRGINPKDILPLARKDVEVVKKEAKFVWGIDSEGKTVSVKANENGKIWSIAIIGPASLIKKEVKEALYKANLLEEAFFEKELLLMEIGFKRGKPYQRPCQNGTNILWRRKWFYFSKKQYLKVSPNLFWFLQHLCQETWHKWKTSKNPFVRSGKSKSFRRLGENIISPGTRYSFSLEDIYPVADIFWAEKNLNSVLKKFLPWLGEMLENILSRQRSKKKWREYAEKMIYSRPLYLLERIADDIGNKYSRANFLNFIWEIKQDEGEMDNKAVEKMMQIVLSNPEERLRNIQIRIRRMKRNCLIFEVYPEYSRNFEDYTFDQYPP